MRVAIETEGFLSIRSMVLANNRNCYDVKIYNHVVFKKFLDDVLSCLNETN